MMFRPRESHDLRLIRTNLVITPQPAHLRWLHDPFDNSVAVATFEGTTSELRFESTVTLEHFETRCRSIRSRITRERILFAIPMRTFPISRALWLTTTRANSVSHMGIAVSGSIGYYRHHEDPARHDPRHSRTVHLHPPHRERRADSRGDAAERGRAVAGISRS